MMGDYGTRSKHHSPTERLADNTVTYQSGYIGNDSTNSAYAASEDQSTSDYSSGKKKKKKKRKKLNHSDRVVAISYNDRVASFSECKSDSIIASSYASAGFIYIAVKDHFSCQHCGLTVSGLKGLTCDPLSLHRTHRPDCKFLSNVGLKNMAERSEENGTHQETDAAMSSNSLMTIQLTDAAASPGTSAQSPPDAESRQKTYNTLKRARLAEVISKTARRNDERFSHYKDNMYCEISRKYSFNEEAVPNHLSAANLATKGFYCDGRNGDRMLQIKCAFCKITITLTDGVSSMAAVDRCHYDLKPDCKFLRGKATQNIPDIYNNSFLSRSETEENTNSPASLSALGINNSFAKHPLLAVPDNRISTYLTFPHTHGSIIDIDLLSEAGYFYEGNSDSATCFYCGCKSGMWRAGEDVWKRHARTSPSCQHVLSTKGASFVSDTLQELGEYQLPKPKELNQNVTTRMIRPRWDTPVMRRAMEMGIDKTLLKTVLISRIKRDERDFRYLAEIVKEVNDLTVPPSVLSKAPHDKLPDVVQLTHNYESDSEDDVDSDKEGHLKGNSSDKLKEVNVKESSAPTPVEPEPEPEPMPIINVRDMISQLTCKICFSGVVGIIFLPCGHLACCVSCAPAMVDCPICRKAINGTVQAFMP